MSDAATAARIGTIVDANVHLWDQATNPVFWLSDRTMLVDMLGDYGSLPDRYTLDDYLRATGPFDIGGVIWSDPGTADPVAAIDGVQGQDPDGVVVGIVTLGDPLAPGFADFVARVADDELVTSVRVRLVPGFQDNAPSGRRAESDALLLDGLRLLIPAGLVATIEASADQLERMATLATELPGLRIVVDHFGWPGDLSAAGREVHLERLRPLAALPHVATRLDALGTIFGAWDIETVRPWLEGAVDLFGCDRCSDRTCPSRPCARRSRTSASPTTRSSGRGRHRNDARSCTTRPWSGSAPDRPGSAGAAIRPGVIPSGRGRCAVVRGSAVRPG